MEKKQIFINTEHAESFIDKKDINNATSAAMAAKATLMSGNGQGADFLGWINLPEEQPQEIVKHIKDDVARLAAKCQLFVVIGIGGSYLGARAVIEAMGGELGMMRHDNRPHIIYAGHTLNEDYYASLLPLLDKYEYGVAVISKSGTTTEPAVAFRIIKQHAEKKYGKAEAQKRIIAITDARRGALHTIAQQENYSQYIIPDNVGGRFSVLTPVGLLPIAMAGYDIDALLDGARQMRRHCIDAPAESNMALRYAATRNALYRSGKKVEMLVSYDLSLRYVSEWWKQLYGESEGKGNMGILPHSLTFTTDLHSMGQYMQEGERTLMETVISVSNAHKQVVIPADEQDLDGVNYLCGKSLNEINHCAEQGTIEAHVAGGVPVTHIEMPCVDEYNLGQLLYFFEYACGVSGYMLGVNPFNQPGVEAYKKNMFRLLGKK